MSGSYDILIVGIGGQGTILASNILGEACLIENRHIKGAETHGMAQRGGSVESHIRIGGEFGPLIAPGQADLLISFDLLEALRYSHYLKKGGKMVVNSHLVLPTSVYTQKLTRPSEAEIIAALKKHQLCLLDADSLAAEAGSPLSANVVMLGAASSAMPLKPESLLEAVRRLVPKKTIEINVKAFESGQESWRYVLMKRRLGPFREDTLYEGDALALLPQVPDGSVDLIVTDPPFAIDFKAQRLNYNRKGSNVLEGYQEIPEEEYGEFTRRWIAEAERVLAPPGACTFSPAGTVSGTSSKGSMPRDLPPSTISSGNTSSGCLRRKNTSPATTTSSSLSRTRSGIPSTRSTITRKMSG